MPSLNRVFLMGNMTRDPELRYTPSGTAVCEFGLAVTRQWTTPDGQKRDETCFVDCSMWGRRGEVIAEYFRKGKPIFVEGRLQLDTWEGKDGQRHSKLKVVAENFEFLGGRNEEGGGGPAGAPRKAAPDGRRPAEPSAERRPPAEPPASPPAAGGEGFNVKDDDIPF
ncbi:MAG TPA: single-stranded DNA-binding protein [Candidatus Brocadiia bacterium]|nr:single-stranded DNA-binding protein [Candidatus Brocadiia bacterium]